MEHLLFTAYTSEEARPADHPSSYSLILGYLASALSLPTRSEPLTLEEHNVFSFGHLCVQTRRSVAYRCSMSMGFEKSVARMCLASVGCWRSSAKYISQATRR